MNQTEKELYINHTSPSSQHFIDEYLYEFHQFREALKLFGGISLNKPLEDTLGHDLRPLGAPNAEHEHVRGHNPPREAGPEPSHELMPTTLHCRRPSRNALYWQWHYALKYFRYRKEEKKTNSKLVQNSTKSTKTNLSSTKFRF